MGLVSTPRYSFPSFPLYTHEAHAHYVSMWIWGGEYRMLWRIGLRDTIVDSGSIVHEASNFAIILTSMPFNSGSIRSYILPTYIYIYMQVYLFALQVEG